MKKQLLLIASASPLIIATVIIILLLWFSDSVAQENYKNPALEINRTNIWQFGAESTSFAHDCPSLHFENGTPYLLNNGKPGGFASMCDTNGNLQLYGGIFLLQNKNHSEFLNGLGVIGYHSNTNQHSLAIPKPGHPELIYYFTVPVRFYYNLIDMRGDNGNGEIIEKNVEILSDPPGVNAKIAAVHHCNGHDIWVMVHELYNDRFRTYLVTDSGISPNPVINQIGPMDNSPGGAEQGGFMKFSPNGKRLAIVFSAITDSLASRVFDFDNSTGILSNPITLQHTLSSKSVSFSPDNSKLYVGNSSGQLYQYDLNAGSDEDIAMSIKKIFENPRTSFSPSMQIGRDGKIYVNEIGAPGNKHLGVINNPNALDTLCDFDWQGIYLNGAVGYLGLNNTAESYFYTGSSAYPCYGEPLSGITQSKTSDDAKVYPNPFSDYALIEIYGHHLAHASSEYRLFDAAGRECKMEISLINSSATALKALLSRGNLPPGIYFLTVKTPTQNRTLKLSIF